MTTPTHNKKTVSSDGKTNIIKNINIIEQELKRSRDSVPPRAMNTYNVYLANGKLWFKGERDKFYRYVPRRRSFHREYGSIPAEFTKVYLTHENPIWYAWNKKMGDVKASGNRDIFNHIRGTSHNSRRSSRRSTYRKIPTVRRGKLGGRYIIKVSKTTGRRYRQYV